MYRVTLKVQGFVTVKRVWGVVKFWNTGVKENYYGTLLKNSYNLVKKC